MITNYITKKPPAGSIPVKAAFTLGNDPLKPALLDYVKQRVTFAIDVEDTLVVFVLNEYFIKDGLSFHQRQLPNPCRLSEYIENEKPDRQLLHALLNLRECLYLKPPHRCLGANLSCPGPGMPTRHPGSCRRNSPAHQAVPDTELSPRSHVWSKAALCRPIARAAADDRRS
nr:hypothetical protein [Paenibacillus sp. XY044]